MNKPFKTYFGGKEASGVYQTIINHIRPHDIFIEAFGGNYTISRKTNHEAFKFIGEIDPEVYRQYPKNWAYGDFLKGFSYQETVKHAFDYVSHLPGMFKFCIYFDPPYPLDSRKDNRPRYGHELTGADHVAFLSYAGSIRDKADILISTYPNDLYKETLKEWFLVVFDGCDRHGKTTEWLFMNYDPKAITELHDSSYYGKNFTERQKIKRHIKNTVAKIRDHPDPIIKREILKQLNAV